MPLRWLHEIKHDGFRVIARKDGKQVRLYSRPGNDLTARFPLIVEALSLLRSRSCISTGRLLSASETSTHYQRQVTQQRWKKANPQSRLAWHLAVRTFDSGY
jgi:ATP-dependent DNA ligase